MPMMVRTIETNGSDQQEAAISTACQEFQAEFPEEVPVPVSCRLLEATRDFAKFLVTVL